MRLKSHKHELLTLLPFDSIANMESIKSSCQKEIYAMALLGLVGITKAVRCHKDDQISKEFPLKVCRNLEGKQLHVLWRGGGGTVR